MNYHNNMKPTTEQILSALNEMIQSKTELKAEKVELANVLDFKNKYDKLGEEGLQITKKGAKAISEWRSSRDKLVTAIDQNIKSFQALEKTYNEIKKQTKELGLNINDVVPRYIDIQDEIKMMNNMKGLIQEGK